MLPRHIVLYAFRFFYRRKSIQYYMLFKVSSFDLVEAYVQHFRVRVPPSPRRPGFFPQAVFGKPNLHGNKRVVGKHGGLRRPCFFLHDDFRGLDPCAALPVVPAAHADESVGVFVNKLFRPLLSRPAPSDYDCGSESAGCFSFSRVIIAYPVCETCVAEKSNFTQNDEKIFRRGAGKRGRSLGFKTLIVTTQVNLRRKGEMGIRKGKYIVILLIFFPFSPFLLMLFTLSLSEP